MPTVRFKMRDLQGAPIANTWFRVEPGYQDSVVAGADLPVPVEFFTNGSGEATATLLALRTPYFITKQQSGAPDQVAYKLFVPASTAVLEAEILYVDLGLHMRFTNDASLLALIDAKVSVLSALNQIKLISSVVLPGSEGLAQMIEQVNQLTLILTQGLADVNARIDSVVLKADAAKDRADQAVRTAQAASEAAGTAGRLAQHVQSDLTVLNTQYNNTLNQVIDQGTKIALLTQRLTALGG